MLCIYIYIMYVYIYIYIMYVYIYIYCVYLTYKSMGKPPCLFCLFISLSMSASKGLLVFNGDQLVGFLSQSALITRGVEA